MAQPTPPFYNGVVTWVPRQCGKISPWQANARAAEEFNIASTVYWQDNVIPATIAGLVLGGIALLGFIFFLIWLCVRPCCRRRPGRRRQSDAEQRQQQYQQQRLKTDGGGGELSHQGEPLSAAQQDLIAAAEGANNLKGLQAGHWQESGPETGLPMLDPTQPKAPWPQQQQQQPPQQQFMTTAQEAASVNGALPHGSGKFDTTQAHHLLSRRQFWPWRKQQQQQLQEQPQQTQQQQGCQRWPPPQQCWRRHADNEGPGVAWTKLGLLVLGTAVVAVGLWGLAQSIWATRYIISNFWLLVWDVNALTNGIYTASVGLSSNISAMQAPLQAVVSQSDELELLFNQTGPQGAQVAATLDTLSTFNFTQLSLAAAAINSAVLPVFTQTINPVLASIYEWQPPTMSIQDTWRFVIFCVLFGLLILIVAVATWAVCSMRHGMLATTCVALTWLGVALLMLGGVGLLRGVEVVSYDACLYTETMLLNRAAAIRDPTANKIVTNAMDYYFGITNLTQMGQAQLQQQVPGLQPGLAAALLSQVLGVDVSVAQALLTLEAANATLYAFLSNGTLVAQAEAAGVAPATVEQLQALETAAAGVLYNAGALQDLLVRDNVDKIYHGGKAYLCCTLNGQAHKVFVPWTVAGSLGLVFVLLASGRVVWQTVTTVPHPLPAAPGLEDDENSVAAAAPAVHATHAGSAAGGAPTRVRGAAGSVAGCMALTQKAW